MGHLVGGCNTLFVSSLFCVSDQTPTPTKFLKNCEEIGLFQELNKNPFEEAFKKAMDGSDAEVSFEVFPD